MPQAPHSRRKPKEPKAPKAQKPPKPPGVRPAGPRASWITTTVLAVALVIVVVTAGVLGAIAVLMTKDPDSTLLGGKPPRVLAVPIHLAPVRDTRPAPCPGERAGLDEAQTTCYLLGKAVKVTSVRQIEALENNDGYTYSVRIAFTAAVRDQVADLIDEQLPDERPIAVLEVQGQAATVLAAPIVTQSMDGDAISIAGFTQEQADKLVERLLGTQQLPGTGEAPADQPPADQPPADQPPADLGVPDPDPGQPGNTPPGNTPPANQPPGNTPPGNTPPGSTEPDGTQPGVPQPGATQPGVPQTGGTPPAVPQAGATGAINPGTGGTTTTQPVAATSPSADADTKTDTDTDTKTDVKVPAARDKRFPTCKEAIAAGYGGPYTKGRHGEYDWYPDLDRDGVACDPQDLG